MLNTVVDQCSSELFSQNCDRWVKELLVILQVLFVNCMQCTVCFSVTCV